MIWLRSIPVHTGKPILTPMTSPIIWVYPRTHGETKYRRLHISGEQGLSPYTRGNHFGKDFYLEEYGSIPVHTGKPAWSRLIDPSRRVYPRTHGETGPAQPRHHPGIGLSPYTRGNRLVQSFVACDERSIPVHTGKPSHAVNTCSMSWVYPRTHGETISMA